MYFPGLVFLLLHAAFSLRNGNRCGGLSVVLRTSLVSSRTSRRCDIAYKKNEGEK
jgi:hypothetical protein